MLTKKTNSIFFASKGFSMASKKNRRKKNTLHQKQDRHTFTISACMMVKDEEEMLPRCLNSFQHLIDELIIVDTGSTDRTVEIARSFGAKVYFHPWENNFSKHRNQSISYASGNWFLIIDADEALDAGTLTKNRLKHCLQEMPENIHAAFFTVQDINQGDKITHTFKSPRLFKNGAGFHYSGTVHNNPEMQGDVISLDILIRHYGYDLGKKKMDQKFIRTSSLLFERIKQNPNDIPANFYLSNLHGSYDKAEEAIKYGKKCLDLLPSNPEAKIAAYDGLYRIIANAYLKQNDTKQALQWFHQGLAVLPDDPDLHFDLCALAVSEGDYALIVKYGLRYLEVVDEYRNNLTIADGRLLYSLDKQCEDAIQYNLMTAFLGLREREPAEVMWSSMSHVVSKKKAMREEYLKNLFNIGWHDLLMERTVQLLQDNPESVELAESLIQSSLDTHRFQQVYDQLTSSLREALDISPLALHIGIFLVAKKYYHEAAEVLAPYYSKDSKENDLLMNLASACENINRIFEAERIYMHGMNIEGCSDAFITNALNFFRKTNNAAELNAAITLLLKRHPTFADIPEDVQLFLAECFLESGQMDHFQTLAVKLCEGKNALENAHDTHCFDPEKIARDFQTLSTTYAVEGLQNYALQCLKLAWLLTDNPAYLIQMGDIYSKNNHPQQAATYYQAALSHNHTTARAGVEAV
jgi:glycosyltransferase involved in cell wall biosynthesis